MAKPNCVFEFVGEADHLFDLPGVGRRIEDERAEVAVQAVDREPVAAGDALHGVQGLARFEIEAEPRPLGIDARRRGSAAGRPGACGPSLPAMALQVADLVEVIDVDHRRLRGTAVSSAGSGLCGPLKMICSPGTPSARALAYSISETTSAMAPSWCMTAQMASR